MIFITSVMTGFKERRPEVKKLHNFNFLSINHLKDAVRSDWGTDVEQDGIVKAGKFLLMTVYLGSIAVGEAASWCTLKPWNGLTPSPEGTVCICFSIAIRPWANKPGWTCVLMPHVWHRRTTTVSLTHLQLFLLRTSCVWNISPCVTTSPWKCHTHHLLIRCFFILKRWIPSSQWPEKGAASFQLWKHNNACLTLPAPAVMRDLPLMLAPAFWSKSTSYTHLNHFCAFFNPCLAETAAFEHRLLRIFTWKRQSCSGNALKTC